MPSGMIRLVRVVTAMAFLFLAPLSIAAEEITGTVTVPYVTGRPERHAFTHRPGWVDVYAPDGKSTSGRIGEDGTFTMTLPEHKAGESLSLIAGFDRMETPPVIVPNWPSEPGKYEVPIQCEYACVPDGYPETWQAEYMTRTREYWQTFIPNCTHLYGCSVFDGPKIVWWGNKINVAVHEGVYGEIVDWEHPNRERLMRVSAGHSDFELPRMGWRHSDLVVEPGRKYALCISGYRSHGGEHFELDAFVRPDNGDGYGPGEVYKGREATGGDLCFLMFGNGHGQIVETHLRSEEWEVFIPKRKPSQNWGQTFYNHGVSLAGIAFWGSNGSGKPVTCDVQILTDGAGGDPVGPVKKVVGHVSTDRPIIRYPDWPGELPGYAEYYKLPAKFFQIAYAPDEIKLETGRTYYIKLKPSEPMMMYADGDYYDDGYAHYEGLMMQMAQKHHTFHSRRWSLLMSVVTYQNPGGAPNDFSDKRPRPGPGPDGNLIANPGAEDGGFGFWTVGGDPVINPSTDIPRPPNHSGNRRFGISVGWNKANMYQYQIVPGIEPGATYVAGFWAAHADDTDEVAELLWLDGPFDGEEKLLVRTDASSLRKWHKYESEPFKPTQSRITIVVRYKHPAPTNVASIHVDDIYLRKVK